MAFYQETHTFSIFMLQMNILKYCCLPPSKGMDPGSSPEKDRMGEGGGSDGLIGGRKGGNINAGEKGRGT